MKLKTYQKNILYMLFIVIVGFILFNAAFMLAFLVNRLCMFSIMMFTNNTEELNTLLISWHYVNVVVVILLSLIVFRTKLNDLFKATYSTMPLIVVLTEIGIQLNNIPLLIWIIGAAIIGAVLLYLYKTKRPWMYYFAVLYVAAVEIFVMTTGMQI